MAVRFVLHVFGLALLWLLLTRQDIESWIIGLPVVLAGSWAGVYLWRRNRFAQPTRQRINLLGMLEMIPYFAWETFKGSIDVSWRAIHPAMPLSPGYWTMQLRLPEDSAARTAFIGMVSLFPGTLAVRLQQDSLQIHALTLNENVLAKLRQLESKVGKMFSQSLAD